MSTENPIFSQIQKDITDNEVVLYMKGTPDQPMCGFSSVVVEALKRLEVPFVGLNVMEDENLRHGIKEFTNWPTIPQLYVKGEFVGGADIIREMYSSGELETLFKEKNILT